MGSLSKTRNGKWFVLAAAILWGTTGTAQAFAPRGAQPAVVGTVRLMIGSFALLMLAVARGKLSCQNPWSVVPTFLAAGSMAAYQLCFFNGVARTGVAVGTIVAIGSAPIFAGFLSFLINKEYPEPKWILATLLTIMGCSLLLLPGSNLIFNPLGVGLALGAGAAYALFTVTSKRLLKDQPSEAVMAVTFCLGAILLSPLLFTADLNWLAQPRGLAVALHLGFIATGVAYALFARGLTTVPAASAVTLSLAEPLTAGTLGIVVLGERLTLLGIVGIGLILSGLSFLSVGRDSLPTGSP
jgi:DME family drug/metabolite transporter